MPHRIDVVISIVIRDDDFLTGVVRFGKRTKILPVSFPLLQSNLTYMTVFIHCCRTNISKFEKLSGKIW